jgi:SAM-dependent methyltransferase
MPLTVAEAFIEDAVSLRAGGSRERVLIENFVSRLRGMFPEDPAWVVAHIRDAEAQVAYAEGSQQRRAFIDNLVGYTTIEYEHDLRMQTVFNTGYGQVRQHVAGMLNAGAAPAKILGVLSDTVQWRVYRVASIAETGASLGPEDVQLEEVDRLDVSGQAAGDPERLTDFLSKHFGREGAHLLAAETVARDLGFDSPFGARHLGDITAVVEDALAARPEYAELIRQLWSEFAGYVGEQAVGTFDQAMYVNELYVVTLAKLLCANVLAGRALHSDDRELRAILSGAFFRAKGLDNLVEYDYFGWLNAEPYVEQLIPVAEDMQRGLRSFDFEAPAAEDLFGQLMAQLADRSQRLLLGQEWTPPWLAERLARKLVSALPDQEQPRFLDMCCGSGSTIVEVVKLAKANPPKDGHDAVDELAQVATGFDIDPLAVMLAKVNWVVAVRDRLDPLDGSRRISIPIYHADSMFAKTPISKLHGAPGDSYKLTLKKHNVDLPSFLVTPERRALFDALLDVAYRVAMQAASEPAGNTLAPVDVDAALDEALRAAADQLGENERGDVRRFLRQLIDALERLQRADLNGIWAFVLRNSYRPGLLAGQFNGLITNPPWLTLSKLADNPYQQALQANAAAYGIQPPGAAHLHTELATTFLLHAVDRYLTDDAVVGCILPETVLNGYHHELFRRGEYSASRQPVRLRVRELWRVAPSTFKNEAIVLIGDKQPVERRDCFPGLLVGEQGDQPIDFQVVQLAADLRTAWSDSGEGAEAGWFDELEFRQGADLMPRTGVFHEVTATRGGQVHIAPIDTATSANAYLVSDVKQIKDFRITATTVPRYLIYDALISKHLVHFELGGPAKALLPYERAANGRWRPVTSIKLAASPTGQAVFAEICDAVGAEAEKSFTLAHYQAKLDTRHKLVSQRVVDDRGFLVVYGAGGELIAAAFAPLTRFDIDRLVIDQTLYSLIVETEDEAIYTTGLFNSRAIDALIAEFKPRGAFGGRHLHKLPTTVTPAYDSAQALHTTVVDATRRLIADFAVARCDPTASEWFDPNRKLAWRRRMIRKQILTKLPSYGAYAEACAALYAL